MTYPDWLIQDIRTLGQVTYIANLTHSCLGSYAEVCFDLAYDEYAQVSDERLSNPEPIKLRYPLSQFPSNPEFLSNRDTFPRNLPHLNPVSESHPASICLWRKGGNSALYLQKGIVACLEVLRDWLEDASLDRLQHDGWEPSPRGGLISFNIDLGEWQEIASKPKYCGKILSISSHVFIDKIRRGPQLGWVIPRNEIKEKKDNSHFLRPFKYNEVSQIRTYFLVPDDGFIESDHCSLKLNSFDSLLEYSSHAQLAKAVSFIQSCKKTKGVSAAVLAIAQRRPLPLIKEIPSLSNDVNASKVEIVSILVVHDNNSFNFHGLQVKSPATSEMLASVSGTDVLDKDLSILGCGSIGGAISDFLIRAGHKRFSLWDDDCFEAHNNARHVLYQTASERAVSALEFKVMKMQERMKQINTEVNVRYFIRKFDAKQVSELQNNTHVIDTTGQAIEPSWLHDLAVPYTRVFITDMGNLAFLMTQVPHDVADMLDIEAVLISLSSSEQRIREWLHNESQLSDKMLGLSCSSATMEMPWFKINGHISSLMPTLLRQVNSPSTCVLMNTLDPDGNPLGLTTFDIEGSEFKFEQAEVVDAQGVTWTITFNQAVLDVVRKIRKNHLPSEAAGYILGLYNIDTKRISIVAATQGQFSSSVSSATLESIEQDREAQEILANSNNMLKPLGTWHSHPGTSAQASTRDLTTFEELLGNKERILPTVMLICAEVETSFLVGVNRDI
jgi:proteasome lid subunit RPN8/RPN11